MKKITVIGAGTMGHGIAQVAACSSYQTTLYDLQEQALKQGVASIRKNLDKAVLKEKLSQEHMNTALALLHTSQNLREAVSGAAVVIEAVPENLDLKKELFAELSSFCGDDTLLATNTSSLSVTEIAAACRSPERVVGMHFFNPPYILKLLEIVRAQQSSDASIDKAKNIATDLDRELIVVQDSPGFASSRLGLALGLEAIRMLQEGVACAQDIDRAMELGYRHPMGPLKLTDLVGLDVRLAIAQYLHQELGGEQFRPPQLLKKMVRAGKLGKKSGQGFYSWN
jgi:3-hydroxybutyryl-CoA dehydrogenase